MGCPRLSCLNKIEPFICYFKFNAVTMSCYSILLQTIRFTDLAYYLFFGTHQYAASKCLYTSQA